MVKKLKQEMVTQYLLGKSAKFLFNPGESSLLELNKTYNHFADGAQL